MHGAVYSGVHAGPNADFTVALRNAAPTLLAELRQLRERNQRLIELLDYLVHNFINPDGIPEDMGAQIEVQDA